MATQTQSFRLGLTVLVILVLLFGSLLFIGGSNLWGPPSTAYAVRFPVSFPLPDEIKGGAPVFCGLRKVGSVQHVEHETRPAPGRTGAPELFVRLDFTVSNDVQMRSDCRVTARGPLLGGGGKLIITDPGSRGDPLPAGTVINGTAGGTFDATLDVLAREIDPDNPAGLLAQVKTELDADNARSLIAKIHRSVDDLNAITASISRQVDPREKEALLAKLNVILDRVNEATGYLRDQVTPDKEGMLLAKLHAGLDTLNLGLTAATDLLEDNRPTIDETLASVQRTADTLDRRITTPIGEQLDVTAEASMLSKLHTLFDRLNGSLADLNVVTGKTKRVLVLNEERINHILANVDETSVHLKAAAKDVRRSPWRLLHKPTLKETKQLNIFDAAREFAEAAAYLDDSATQLRALMESRGGQIPADDPDLQRIRAQLEETFERFTVAEESLWKQLTE
jgi:ABC-type transporter Mla subunit MlaD